MCLLLEVDLSAKGSLLPEGRFYWTWMCCCAEHHLKRRFVVAETSED